MNKINHNKSQRSVNFNPCSQRIEQLYINHFIKEQRNLNKNLEVFEKQIKSMKSFKVQNKTSKFLIQKQKFKPIYQRTNQILLKREKSIEKIKQSMPKSKQKIQQEEMGQILQKQKAKYRNLSRDEFQKKIHDYEQRSKMRMQKLQREKLLNLKLKNTFTFQKPHLSSSTIQWWQKKKLKKNLSNNVFQRFEQYDLQKKQNWQNYLEIRKNQQTPFVPKISQATKELARKSASRRNLKQNMSRSMSFNILSKNQIDELTFIEKKQQNDVSYTERSVQKNEKHRRSSTTANTSKSYLISSRQALIQRKYN